MHRLRVVLVLAGAASLAGVPLGYAQVLRDGGGSPASAPRARPADAGDPHDPDNVTGVSRFVETSLRGHARFMAKDYAGAIAAYKEAIALAPQNALGPLFVGQAQLAQGDTDKAQESFADAERLSDEREPSVRGRILFAQADLLERTKRWQEARKAWKKYADFADSHRDAGAYANTAASRLQVLDDMLKQDQSYEAVRQRIAADDGGAPGGSKGPDASKKK
jgi:tetratricopeptide (TPR) repeat protein